MSHALLFDMDGLLLDTERVARDSFVEVSASYGLPDAEAFFLTLVGSSGKQTSERIAEAMGTDASIGAFKSDWGQRFQDALSGDVPLRPGVGEVLPELSARGHSMVVVTSSGSVGARELLRRVGLMDHFRDLVGSDCVTAHKPDPEPYLEGARRAGSSPEACYAFEDSDKGVAAAVAAGCRVSQVPDLRPPDTALPRLGQGVFSSLPEALVAQGLL